MAEKKSPEKFRIEFEVVANGEYKLLSEYKTKRDKINVQHVACGNSYEILPYNFIKRRSCPYCSKKSKKSHEQFVKEIEELFGEEIIVLAEYKNNETHVKVRHTPCGVEYMALPYNLLRGRACGKCAGNTVKTHDEFIREVFDKVGKEYEVLGRYVNNREKIKFRHNTCGHIYEVTANHFLSGNRCPRCNFVSDCEQAIILLLESLNLRYEKEKVFSGLRSDKDKVLRFDFCIYKKENGNEFFLLEYDGKRHYSREYEGEEQIRLKANDQLKNVFCQENKIQLLRLRYINEGKIYTEFLKDYLKQNGYISLNKDIGI